MISRDATRMDIYTTHHTPKSQSFCHRWAQMPQIRGRKRGNIYRKYEIEKLWKSCQLGRASLKTLSHLWHLCPSVANTSSAALIGREVYFEWALSLFSLSAPPCETVCFRGLFCA